MPKQVRVNVRSLANTKAVRHEKRNGRDVVIVPSATLPDDVIMNDIMYPATEIESSYASLNRTPAPLGHPTINGKFVSARDPEGINLGWIGAWNENLRREEGRVFLDKVIDVEMANRSEGGKAVLSAIEKGEPVHTSTGLLCNLEAANGDVAYKFIARNIEFDHDAILLDVQGAATPEQGVGMMVNSQGKEEEIEVINCSMSDSIDQEIDWAGQRLVDALQRKENLSVWSKVKSAITEAISGSKRETSINKKEDDMPVSEEQFSALSGEVKALAEAVKNMATALPETINNAIKPVTDHVTELANAQKAKDDAEAADLVGKVVKANLLTEDAAKAAPLNTLRELAKLAEPGKAANLNTAFKGNEDEDIFAGYDLNAGMEGK